MPKNTLSDASGRPQDVHLAVDLTDAGAHPAAWRAQGAQGARLFDPARLQELAATAQRGLLDFILFDDAFSLQPRHRGALQGRLDAALISARLAPLTRGIGLVPTVTTTHTEPFHVSKAIATIDHVSDGRAGWQVGVSATAAEAGHFGRKGVESVAGLYEEAGEAIEVVTRLWDSWEDDAEIRDVATGRFVDREKLHYIDYEGVRFAVKGPSITPRSPQGQPPVIVREDGPESLALAAARADVVRIDAEDADAAYARRQQIHAAVRAEGRDPGEVRVLADLHIVIGADDATAQARLALLDGLGDSGWSDSSATSVGTAAGLADLIETWVAVGAVDGFVIRPSSLQTDLAALVDEVVPLLQERNLFRSSYPGTTLRDTLGLGIPANRYGAITAGAR